MRNNSLYFGAPVADSQGIALATRGTSEVGSNVQVVSNLIYFGAGHNHHHCFDTTGVTLANFTAFNNNLCFHAAKNGRYSVLHASLTNAKAASFDTVGLDVDPRLVAAPALSNNWSMALKPDSPAMNAGHASLSSAGDRALLARPLPADIGAREYSLSGDRLAPAAPGGMWVD